MMKTERTCAKSCCPAARCPVDLLLNRRRFLASASDLELPFRAYCLLAGINVIHI